MVTAYEFTLIVYNLTLVPMIFFSILFLLLTLVNLLFTNSRPKKYRQLKELPFVSVQIPTFNDPIARRCIKRCMKFDYPKDRYEIVIVDDSTHKKTQMILKKFADENPGFIKYIHREDRRGFKPGALNNAMKITKGEIITVFDSDWIPNKDYLKRIVQPFSDPDVAIVQSRQGFYNADTNLITRFAAYTLMIYHAIIMPIHNKANSVFFCGTAGALRRKAFEKVGGWNSTSVTEDSELTIKLLLEGYKTVYLDFATPSEVPDTFESFIKQQMRWCYGNARVFIDNAWSILFKKGLTLKQRIMVMYVTLANSMAPIVVLMTVFGFSGWFLGEPTLFQFQDVLDLFVKFFYTAGFLLMGVIALYRHKILEELPQLVLAAFTMGLVIVVTNSIAFFKAIFNSKLHWFCTPKIQNKDFIK